ncbi:hypothetical protein H072_4014 [Dactylellina haptotyla CBS 200.50]|uniref:C3HC-type domain-containing protein n=1 Tax=Dactylellina haptotyla (strain CBS 200.50) TaxID=1284197 RepID=S8BRD8_DACHA|nr:hypothetical protein H072_4014 [Dactylellina haptotyla CBS 200.50]
MFTAKRKIHNLLHNATSRTAPSSTPPSTTAASSPEKNDTPTRSLDLSKTPTKSLYQQPKSNGSLSSLIDESIRKRRRTEQELAKSKSMFPLKPAVAASSRPVTPIADSRASSVAPGTGTSPKPIKVAAARYAPWDRNEFLQRLETFRSVSSWSSKPERVNEVEWAKRGWVCMQNGKNRVRCTSHCGGELVVKVEFDGFEVTSEEEEADDDDEEAIQGEKEKLEALISKYEVLIVEGHEEGCLWRKRGCDKAIYRLPLQPATEARTGFYARYKSLSNLSDDQQVINLTKPAEVDLSSLKLPEDMPEDQLKQNALTLALFGWAKDANESSVEMVKCDACFRRLGLWLFVKRPSVTEEEGDEFSSMSHLNVYCPWANAASQTGEHAGWEILLRILKSSIPGNLVAAASPSRPKTAAVLPHKTEDEHRKDDENRWKRLKSLRKSYGSSFAMSILGGKKGDKGGSGASPAKQPPGTVAL